MATLPVPMEVVFDVHEFELSPSEEHLLREKLDGLARQVEQFPVAELRVFIQAVRSQQMVVKLTLFLPNKSLTVDGYDRIVQPAFDRCLDSLQHELEGYKDRLNRRSEAAKLEEGTHAELLPEVLVDPEAIERAVAAGDYADFHAALLPYEEELRMRIGRWVQRYPEVNDLIGRGLEIADIQEEVFLLAFDGYSARPQNVPLGTWLENLIHPAIKALAQNPDEALENIAAVRSVRGAVEGRKPV
jgi:ribosome-associated translation inhibitor RaiA